MSARMNVRDALRGAADFWEEFSKLKSALAGLALLAGFAFLGIAGPSIVPFPGAKDHWRDIEYWQDSPQAAPPAWTNWLSREKGAVSTTLSRPVAAEGRASGGGPTKSLAFEYRYGYDRPPRDLVLRYRGSGRVALAIRLERPDALAADLYDAQVQLSPGRFERLSLARDCAKAAVSFVSLRDEALAVSLDPDLVSPMDIFFSALPEPGGAPGSAESKLGSADALPLRGSYRLVLQAELLEPSSTLDEASVAVAGDVCGILGTDGSKRDLFSGVVIGVRWALIIGILTSIVTVVLGVALGVIAAYYGGPLDWALSRLYELVYLMPVLPFLIVMAAVFKPSIWTMILMICLFFWVGPYKPVYGMALQIKEESYVEASRALGASRLRIVFRHIVPILLPYSFAVMALSIPGVIVYEASVSLLGLGDATKVTWGQILHDALAKGAVINGLWWWVVPPGLMIALMGMSFAFLGTALDKILHPKLRTR
jgi:peptide/nickel transport system permease protein